MACFTGGEAGTEVKVQLEDFLSALDTLVPSVSIQEMLEYDLISKHLRSS